MPYVQRDSDGKITGVFANKQPGYAEEFLPDGNNEITEFLQRRNFPPVAPMTHEEARRLHAQHEKLEEEHKKLRSTMLSVLQSWTELELALSTLLYEILKLHSSRSKIPYAIYFSPSGLEGRMAIVNNTLDQFILENRELNKLQPLWKRIYGNIKRARDVRNVVAHGSPITLSIRGKEYVRLTSPAFDVIRVGRKISERKIPGLSVTDLAQNIRKVRHQVELVDEVNRIINAFNLNAHETLQERFQKLETLLNHPDSQ